MSFAQQYEAHAYHDLIAEAEKQGIGVGVERERERIIKLFEDFITKQSSYIDDETPADIAEGYLVEIESAEYWIDRIKGENK